MKKNVNGIERDMTAEEIAEFNSRQITINEFDIYIKELRSIRNHLLAKCDWTDLPNAPLTEEKKLEWQTYRTNLRNITNGLTTVEQVEAVEFPEKP